MNLQQLIKDLCERNREVALEASDKLHGEDSYEYEFNEVINQITQQTAEAVLSAVREIVKDACNTTEPEWIYEDIMEELTQLTNKDV